MPAGTAYQPRPGPTAPRTRAGKRQDLSGHDDHLRGMTRLLLGAAHTIGTLGTARSGRCAHCGGTGDARPLRGAERLVLAAVDAPKGIGALTSYATEVALPVKAPGITPPSAASTPTSS